MIYYIVASNNLRVNNYRIVVLAPICEGLTMTVQERISELMNKKGWTKYKLAQETGLYQTTVYDWFNDKGYTPDRKSIELICAAMNISIVEFYSGIDEGELNGEQSLLLQLFAKVPESKRQLVFDLLRTLADENK